MSSECPYSKRFHKYSLLVAENTLYNMFLINLHTNLQKSSIFPHFKKLPSSKPKQTTHVFLLLKVCFVFLGVQS